MATPKKASQEGSHEEQLEHLEATLKWLRRESAAEPAQKLPRTTPLPPVPGIRSPDQLERETYIDGIRVPRSLKPSAVPPPPMREEHPNHLGAVLRVTIACVIAAPIAYYFAVGNPFATPQSPRGPVLASAGTEVAAAVPVATQRVAQVQTRMQAPEPPAPQPQATQPQAPQPQASQPQLPQGPAAQANSPWPAAAPASEAAAPRRAETTGMLRDVASLVPTAPAQPAPPPSPIHALPADEVSLLLKQGERFIAAGDLVTARLVLRRAAEAGDADGALAMGMTYDPAVLEKIGVRGLVPDIEQARSWYEKARQFGSAEAPRRLELLASR